MSIVLLIGNSWIRKTIAIPFHGHLPSLKLRTVKEMPPLIPTLKDFFDFFRILKVIRHCMTPSRRSATICWRYFWTTTLTSCLPTTTASMLCTTQLFAATQGRRSARIYFYACLNSHMKIYPYRFFSVITVNLPIIVQGDHLQPYPRTLYFIFKWT